MGRLNILPGYITAEITCANVWGLLNSLTANGIMLKNIQYRDDLTIRVTIQRESYQKLLVLTEKHGAALKVIGIFGVFPVVERFLKRPILMIFLLLILLLTCYIPGRIFFIGVEGNTNVPEKYILEVAAECGIDFGAKRRFVRSEMMKNRLLEKIPQLQWAGINTAGCTAVISVREKTSADQKISPNHKVSSIVASRDGIIQSCTVQQGNTLCAVGQAVKAGQVLVSGYLDCGIITKTTHADAEIKALTFRDLEVVAACPVATKGTKEKSKTKYALRIGKKLIKFYKDSGNLDTTCDKIYAEEYVYLPGGFRLPIATIKETEISYNCDGGELPTSDAGAWLTDFANTYLRKSMISGEIISADIEVTPNAGVFCLRGRYTCMEMIGQIKHEEFLPKDEGK